MEFRSIESFKYYIKCVSKLTNMTESESLKTYFNILLLSRLSQYNFEKFIVLGDASNFATTSSLTNPILNLDLAVENTKSYIPFIKTILEYTNNEIKFEIVEEEITESDTNLVVLASYEKLSRLISIGLHKQELDLKNAVVKNIKPIHDKTCPFGVVVEKGLSR